jgi:hypothetical protein
VGGEIDLFKFCVVDPEKFNPDTTLQFTPARDPEKHQKDLHQTIKPDPDPERFVRIRKAKQSKAKQSKAQSLLFQLLYAYTPRMLKSFDKSITNQIRKGTE